MSTKLSRKERKRIKAGKSEGYSLGYAEGYAKELSPEFREAMQKAYKAKDDAGVLDLIEDIEEV